MIFSFVNGGIVIATFRKLKSEHTCNEIIKSIARDCQQDWYQCLSNLQVVDGIVNDILYRTIADECTARIDNEIPLGCNNCYEIGSNN